MSGLELISRLRSSLGLHIPFAIAISGGASQEDEELAISAGFGHYFVKPVNIKVLLALVASDAVTRFIATANRKA
jgi:CheY-like chemotaxis protein